MGMGCGSKEGWVNMNLTNWLASPVQRVKVFSNHEGAGLCLGELHYNVGQSLGSFQWSKEALAREEQWSPFRMPLGNALQTHPNAPSDFNGLPGLLNDALPDGWGLRLMDKAFRAWNVPDSCLTPALRLAVVGGRAWGALSFEPAVCTHPSGPINLPDVAHEVHQWSAGRCGPLSSQLLATGGMLHGARPKIMVDLSDTNPMDARVSDGTSEAGYSPWIVKFAAREEHPLAPVGEHIYMELAKKAGVNVMPSMLLTLNGKPAFATQRFDRKHGQRVFTHSLSGLLHVTHRECNLDYVHIGQVIQKLSCGGDDLEQAFRRACFNAAFSVRDDHSKNTSFLKEGSQWKLAPAYDLTYMEGPGGYHSMTFADSSGKDPTAQDLMKVAAAYGLEGQWAKAILQEVVDTTTAFVGLANDHDLPSNVRAPIAKRIAGLAKKLDPIVLSAPSPKKSK